MLYILPPPRTPNPPSPWESILCAGGGGAAGGTSNFQGKRKPPPRRVRLRSLPPKSDDGSSGAQDDNMETNRNPKSLSECYFAGKGTALVLPAAEAQIFNRRSDAHGGNIRKHLQSIVDLLRPEETLKMAVKLESVHIGRIRYLVIISRMGKRAEESCLLGIDCNEKTTVGLVLKVMADTTIRLDGDGGFSVSVCNRHHIFKPVSVQAMWSALQTLHKVSSKAREQNYFQGGLTHDWVVYYEKNIESDRSCLNEWHAMDNLESKRPPSPDSVRTKPTERQETEKVIRATLKEIMMSVDLDEVTSKYIRTRLEEDLDMDLGEYKSFIDQEMLTILGQMDSPTEIFDHVYLGSEWNASNYEELQRNGVGHILNVTREIDNFFPGTFNYYNVRVCDDEKTDLLKYWDDTFKYITSARKKGSKVLVHCKMGVSRSASVVIAYAMKAYNWDFQTAMQHVREKRTCIKPNTSFLLQLETYQGILDAMKNKEKLQRSKSETNLKSPGECKLEKIPPGSEPTPIIQALPKIVALSGHDLRIMGTRPKSWSPDNLQETAEKEATKSSSLEDLRKEEKKESQARHVLMPCDNGESYSVSPNRIVHLPASSSVKDRISELESKKVKLRSKKEIWDPGEDSGTSEPKDQVWTSSTVVQNIQVPQKDPFSNQLDRVFDREEKKQQRNSVEVSSEVLRECPSRQSSWSSYDSAVVLGSQNEVALSRHSSWGSGDTRTVPSRNSSWGSYDLRVNPEGTSGIFAYDKEDIPFHPGTVKRTKQKIEGKNEKSSSSETLFEGGDEKTVNGLNELNVPSSAISPTIKIPGEEKSKSLSRLSASAPETSSMDLVPKDCSLSRSASNVSRPKPKTDLSPGIVTTLKKEFEAKTSTNQDLPLESRNKVSSTPSSPVSEHQDEKIAEMNVKNLLGYFENKEVAKRPKNGKTGQQKNNRHSSCVEGTKWKNGSNGAERPPIVPVVKSGPQCLVTSVIASATKKQQQQYGKSHPLARLTMRHNNPLYNTM